MIHALFMLPVRFLNMLLPFDAKAYKTSTDAERKISQYLHNKVRLAAYNVKRSMRIN